jgi:hypothetical protein
MFSTVPTLDIASMGTMWNQLVPVRTSLAVMLTLSVMTTLPPLAGVGGSDSVWLTL